MFENEEEYQKCRDGVLQLLSSGVYESMLLGLKMQHTFAFKEVTSVLEKTLGTFFSSDGTKSDGANPEELTIGLSLDAEYAEYIAQKLSDFFRYSDEYLRIYSSEPTFTLTPKNSIEGIVIKNTGKNVDYIRLPKEFQLANLQNILIVKCNNVVVDLRNIVKPISLIFNKCSINKIQYPENLAINGLVLNNCSTDNIDAPFFEKHTIKHLVLGASEPHIFSRTYGKMIGKFELKNVESLTLVLREEYNKCHKYLNDKLSDKVFSMNPNLKELRFSSVYPKFGVYGSNNSGRLIER